jgi:hypothetical protein
MHERTYSISNPMSISPLQVCLDRHHRQAALSFRLDEELTVDQPGIAPDSHCRAAQEDSFSRPRLGIGGYTPELALQRVALLGRCCLQLSSISFPQGRQAAQDADAPFKIRQLPARMPSNNDLFHLPSGKQ